MPKQTECPRCGITWVGESIPYGLWQTGQYATQAEAEEAAEAYGWSPESNLRFNVNVVGVEMPRLYDGVSYWKCLKCGVLVNRFTNEVFGGEDVPGRFDLEQSEGEA